MYERYNDKFGITHTEQDNFTKIMNGAHIRLSLDGKTIWKDYMKPVELEHKTNSIFLHDNNLGAIPESIDIIKELTSRYTLTKGEYDPRLIGMKFPVQLKMIRYFKNGLISRHPSHYSFYNIMG